MSKTARYVGLLLCLVASALGAAAAETVYRTVDDQGDVHFSDRPPPPAKGQRIEVIEVPLLPTVSMPAAAQRPNGRPGARGDAGSDARGDGKDRGPAAAQQAVADARRALEEAKVVRDDDWQRLANRRRVLSQHYFERVSQAEAALLAAEQRLAAIGR